MSSRPSTTAVGHPLGRKPSQSFLMRRFVESKEDETAFNTAKFTVLLLLLAVVCLCGLYAVYRLLYMFLKPMLWATLVGVVLFPFKHRVASIVRGWLNALQQSHTPIVVGCLLLPYQWLNAAGTCLWQTFTSVKGAKIIAAYLTLYALTNYRMFAVILSLVGKGYGLIDSLIALFTRKWIIPVIILYTVAYVGWVYVQPEGQINKKIARALSVPIWFFVLSFAATYCGPLRVLVFIGCSVVLGLIAAGAIMPGDDDDEVDDKGQHVHSHKKDDDAQEPAAATALGRDESVSVDEALTGDSYLRIIFSLCFLLWTVRHTWMLALLFVVLLYAAIKKMGERTGLFEKVESSVGNFWSSCSDKLMKVVDVTVAGPIRKFVKFAFTSDRMFVTGLERSMDVVSSVIVMLGVVLFSFFAMLFIGYQLHGETVHLVKLTTSVLSSPPEWLNSAVNYTEGQLKQHDIDNYVEQAYTQGRAWLATKVRSLADAQDTERANLLEHQAKLVVDNVYQMWLERSAEPSANMLMKGKEKEQKDMVTHLQQILTKGFTSMRQEIMDIVQENMDTLMAIGQACWAFLAANVSFLWAIVGTLLGFVLGFGLDLINFLIEMIVFLSVVYYLLAGSKERFLPLEWMSAATPSFANDGVSGGSDVHTVTGAIEQAISGVFVLSAKMAIFYGLYTYFVHALFDLNIIFVPSILATLFAAVPMVPPYAVCFIGAIELWLVRGEPVSAVIFAIASIAPVTFADGTFYKEVKGSHPYVTGLAVIGGMYWLGLEGAIIGPIILCCMIVMANVYAGLTRGDHQ